MPVVWTIYRSLDRSVYVEVIAKFSGMIDLLGYGAPHERASRAWRSAKKLQLLETDFGKDFTR